jgi:hypothetical protein
VCGQVSGVWAQGAETARSTRQTWSSDSTASNWHCRKRTRSQETCQPHAVRDCNAVQGRRSCGLRHCDDCQAHAKHREAGSAPGGGARQGCHHFPGRPGAAVLYRPVCRHTHSQSHEDCHGQSPLAAYVEVYRRVVGAGGPYSDLSRP